MSRDRSEEARTAASALAGRIRNRLVVSCQAAEGGAFYASGMMARFARAAQAGGAAGIRANGSEDVREIASATGLPVIGIQKRLMDDGRILITSTVEDALTLARVGAAAVALDCTARGVRFGALDRLRALREEHGIAVAADIATEAEAQEAEAAGADFILSTMRGYTDATAHLRRFEPDFIARLAAQGRAPVIAEGRIAEPGEAAAALRAGALAVIVGTAITRPHEIARRYAEALARGAELRNAAYLGLDLGGTRLKYGVVQAGELKHFGSRETPAAGGAGAVLAALKEAARGLLAETNAGAVGVATGGWVDAASGRVVHATASLPGWTGIALAGELRAALGLPVFAANDAHCFALAAGRYGAARGCTDFLAVTLGTGLGGAVVVNGRLARGASQLGGALGRAPADPGGTPCGCGRRGCLETLVNEAALLEAAGARWPDARTLIAAAREGDARARAACAETGARLGRGLAGVAAALGPALIVAGGGVAQQNPWLLEAAEEALNAALFAPAVRRIRVVDAGLGYEAGVLGAAELAARSLEGAGL